MNKNWKITGWEGDKSGRVTISAEFGTEADAKEAASVFPKFIRSQTYTIHGGESGTRYGVNISATIGEHIAGNPENETGIKRIRKAASVIRKSGGQIVPELAYCQDATPIEKLVQIAEL